VEVAVAVPGKPGEWQMKFFGEIQPHYWRKPLKDAGEE
jgi:cytidine deaminase